MVQLAKDRGMRQSHSLLESGCTRGMLDEGDITWVNRADREIVLGGLLTIDATNYRGALFCRDVRQELLREFLVQHHQLCPEISRHPRETESIFGGLDLEMGISEDGRDRSYCHRAGEGSHERDALGHHEPDTVATPHPPPVQLAGLAS